MANVTIPQIAGVATALANADLIEVSQSGVSAQAAIGLIQGRLLNIRYFLSAQTTTYTPTSGTTSVVILLGGAGGGGGASTGNPGPTNFSWGLSGQGGAWLMKRLTSSFSGKQFVIGGGGPGGTAGGNGTKGGDSTFDAAGANYIAHGGTAGSGGLGPTTNFIEAPGASGAQATASNGDINVSGALDGGSVNLSASTTGFTGPGGSSPFGSGGAASGASGNSSSPGTAGQGNGSGGSGAISSNNGAAASGGAGADGFLIIYEYT